jgi:hypothetical protein
MRQLQEQQRFPGRYKNHNYTGALIDLVLVFEAKSERLQLVEIRSPIQKFSEHSKDDRGPKGFSDE